MPFINHNFCYRLQDLTINADDSSDLSDLELIHHIYIDLSRITRLLEGTLEFEW